MKVNYKSTALLFFPAFVLTLVLAAGSVAATSGSHYPSGGNEGVLAASIPPPGVYYRIYLTKFNATKTTDNDGDVIDGDFDLDVFAMTHRFVRVTNKKILGADFLYQVIAPLADTSIEAFGVISDSRSLSLGDVSGEIDLSWHKPRWDAVLGVSVTAPTGEYDADQPASPGLGYWTGQFILGGVYYFDTQKTWSLSALSRVMFHTKQEDTNVRPGSEFCVDYGLGKEVPLNSSWSLRPGITGTTYWQIGEDSDDGVGTVKDEKKKAYNMGAEINFTYIPKMLAINLRASRDFASENTSEGSRFVVTMTKAF